MNDELALVFDRTRASAIVSRRFLRKSLPLLVMRATVYGKEVST